MSLTTYRARTHAGFPISKKGRFYDDAECTRPQTVFIESCARAPHIDISEDRDNLYLEVELPGLDEKDVQISIANNILTIRGEKCREPEKTSRAYHRIERSFGEFLRQFALAPIYDQRMIKTQFCRGILEVTIPKSASSDSQKHEISISPSQ